MKGTGTLLLALFLGICFASHCGATVYQSDGLPSNIQQIHNNQAQNGDTITLPAGIFAWTTGVVISKAITLQGTGVGSTIIRDAVQGNDLISWTLAAGYLSRLTGIEFQDGGRTSTKPGLFYVSGSNTNGSQFRMDHCKLNNLNGYPIFDTVLGVIDHNSFVITGKQRNGMFIYGNRWNNQ